VRNFVFTVPVLLATTAIGLWALPLSAQGADAPSGNTVRLESLDLANMEQAWGKPSKNRSVENRPMKIGGKAFAHGVGTHADSEMAINLNGQAKAFSAMVGLDDEVGTRGALRFSVTVDGKEVVSTPVMKGGDAAREIHADLTGAKMMVLNVSPAGDSISYDHGDWAEAVIALAPGATAAPRSVNPETIGGGSPVPEIASGDAKEPRIHGARVVGTTPGRPFVFKVPVTGEGAIKISARGLPEGLTISEDGIITGSVKGAGESTVTLSAKSDAGSDTRELKIVAGQHKLSLTPPMGWNSWNVWGGNVTAEHVRAAADAMISSGMAAKGFMYVNIDDTWEGPQRAADGQITTNKKFGDIKALADYVHSKGLKLGIYSSPGPKTCAGYLASYQHEDQDAKTYAAWGVDYLKYDWCSYGGVAKGDHSLAAYQKPYIVMRESLDKADRDIVYSLCQYGMGDVWEWGGQPPVDGNCWRTTGDIVDTWGSMSGIGFAQGPHAKYAGPGHWNDPDMLVVGQVGWGHPHPSRLNPNEQLTHITLWSMLAAPLLVGCDMSHLDKFTTDLLTNAEVIDIDQDPLGSQAVPVAKEGSTEVWARPLWDGTFAVALFNRGAMPGKVAVKWEDLGKTLAQGPGLAGKQRVRDLWKQKDLGESENGYEATVPRHGAQLLKVGRARQSAR